MKEDRTVTFAVGNTLGRITVAVWKKGNIHEWNFGFQLSLDEALQFAKELTEAANLGPRVGTWADLGIDARQIVRSAV